MQNPEVKGQNSKHLSKYLSNFLIDQKVAGNSPRTIQFYSQNVSRFIEWLEKEFGNADLSSVDLRNVKLYTLHLKESMKFDVNGKRETDEPLSDKTVQTYVRAVKSFISYLGKEGFVDEGMAHKIKLPKATVKQVEILTEEEIKTIADLLKKKKTNHYRDLAIFYVFIECGDKFQVDKNCLALISDAELAKYVKYLKHRRHTRATIKTNLSAVRLYHSLCTDTLYKLSGNAKFGL